VTVIVTVLADLAVLGSTERSALTIHPVVSMRTMPTNYCESLMELKKLGQP
jgi:hypothetical protein